MIIPEYMSFELIQKGNEMQDTILEVKKVFYSVSDQAIKDQFLNKKIANNFIANANNQIIVQTNDLTFFETLEIFLSSARNIGINPDLISPIYIIDSSSGQHDFRNFYIKSLNRYQISAINILINCETIIVNSEISKEFLKNIFYQRVKEIYIIVFTANIFFTGFHILLIFLIIIIINYFKKTLHLNICVMSHLMKDYKINFIRNKVLILKQLALLYNADPEELYKNLKILRKNYREKILLIKNKSVDEKKQNFDFNKNYLGDHISIGNISRTSSHKKNSTSIKSNCEEKSSKFPILKPENDSIGNLLKNNQSTVNNDKNIFKNQNQSFFILSQCKLFFAFKKMLILFFIFFLAYFIIFYYAFLQIHNSHIDSNKLSELNFENHQKIIKHGVLMKVMLALNRTRETHEKILTWGNNQKYSYLEDLHSLLSDLNSLLNYIHKHKEFENITKYFYDYIDCDNFYDGLYKDAFYKNILKLYIARNKTTDFLYKNLKKICKFFPSIKQKDVIFTFQELNGFNRRIFNKFLDNEPQTYEKLKSILDSDLLNDMHMMILLILRPIRVFTQNNLMVPLVTDAFNGYITFIITNLVMNFLVELLFFYMIIKLVINKTFNIDKEMKNMIKTFMIQ